MPAAKEGPTKDTLTMAQSQDSVGSAAPAADVSASDLARVEIRGLRLEDQAAVEDITAEAFRGVSIDEVIEQRFGPLRPLSWQTIKSTAVGAEVREQAATCYVAELDGQVIGYITTAVSQRTSTGRIPNIGIARGYRGLGLGTRLIEYALASFRRQGLRLARIETLVQNSVGDHLYRKLGFQEIVRQIHFAQPLEATEPPPADGSRQEPHHAHEVTP